MGIIKRKIISFLLRDFYALKDLDHPAFGEELHKLKIRKKMTSEPAPKFKKAMNIEPRNIGKYVYYVMRSRKKSSTRKVMYIHGGGFYSEAFKSHWEFCARLADTTGCEIIFPVYPLVPESNTAEAHDMLLSVYREVIADTAPSELILIGDSAGGTLCLSLSMMARDNGLPMSRELILISPGFGMKDLSKEESERLEVIKEHDFMIGQFPIRKIAELWNGGTLPVDYRTDVTLGSIDGLPEIIMFSGTYDILNIPARRFAARLKAEGHPHRYIEKEGGYHVYVLSKKSKEEFELIASEVGN